jgi:hypothetical protein
MELSETRDIDAGGLALAAIVRHLNKDHGYSAKDIEEFVAWILTQDNSNIKKFVYAH